MHSKIWLFAYGSLLWRPGVDYTASDQGRVYGWCRKFWQGSPDHRGTLDSPGRVVTLVPQACRQVTGRVYALSDDRLEETLKYLDHRESGGYVRAWITVQREHAPAVRALSYVALPGNPHYLGASTHQEIFRHILRSEGPSGKNIDYYHDLIAALDRLSLTPGERDELVLGADTAVYD